MGRDKRIFSFVLAVIMALAIVPAWALRTRADEETIDLMEPYVENGVVYWDPSIDPVSFKYYEAGNEPEYYGGLYNAGGQFNLHQYAAFLGFHTGDCVYEFVEQVNGQYIPIISGTYHYETPYEQLAKPTNLKLDNYILSWDAVPNAKKYEVGVVDEKGNYVTSFSGIAKTQCSVRKMLTMNKEKEYTFYVKALNYDGYPWSDPATLTKTVHWAPDAIENLKLSEDGILSWDAFPGAVGYKVYLDYLSGGTDDNPVWTETAYCDLNADLTHLDVEEFIKRGGIDKGMTSQLYRFEICARDSDYASISQTAYFIYDYEFTSYDLYIMGTRVTQENLDFFGNGSLVFDPETNTLHCNMRANSGDDTESLLGLYGDAADDAEPVIRAEMDLTIDGVLDLGVNAPATRGIISSSEKVTFAKDMVFKASSKECLVYANKEIEFLGGTYDLRCVSDDCTAVSSDNMIVIRGEIESLSIEAKGTPMSTKYGRIVLEKVMVETPEGAKLPSDEKYFVQADGSLLTGKLVLKPALNQDDPPITDTPTPEPGTDTPTPEPGPDTPTPVEPGPGDPSNPQPGNPGQPVKDPSFEDFVERLYVVALGRPSEAEGKAYWVEQVVKNGFTGADCARFFMLGAPEFLGRNLTDDEFVEVLYKTYFDRDSEPDGKAYWMGRLASGTERAVLVEEFIESVEWCNICAMYGVKSGALYHKATVPSKNAVKFATRLYTCCLGRDPEEEGLQYWALALTNLDATGYQAASLFFTLPEFVGLKTTNEEYLTRLYTTFMGREPEAEGFAYWLGHLSTDMNRLQVLQGFAQSQEFTNICNEYGIDRGTI